VHLFLYCFLGKNLPLLTDFFYWYIPLYDKFRAVSSIQVVKCAFRYLAIWDCNRISNQIKKSQWKSLYETTILSLRYTSYFVLSKSMFSFLGGTDAYFQESYGPDFQRFEGR
jgi:hypothetical protein